MFRLGILKGWIKKVKHKWLLAFFIFATASGLLSVPAIGLATLSVRIQEWDVPTPNSRPHDPSVAPDGSLWYTGMRSNTLGRVDPRTGQIREFPLKTPDSGPHGLVADKEGNIWFTANYKGYLGRLDPRTGKVTEYPIPDRAAQGPHTPVFDQKGILWFTVQEGDFVGRLDPQAGVITLKKSLTPSSVPYGIAVNSKGVPFFCEFGTNKLASIDPISMEITEYPLPQNARPRRLAIASSDQVYYTDFARGYLGRLDPVTRKVEEWLSPGRVESRPYGIAITPDGVVWYSESGVTPNTIVRFDPSTKAFATWPIPSGGGVVRNMVSTPEGDLYIACSGVNKVGIVKIGH
ncbi:MAG TPA: lyase [Thermodesulfobacteriota bacterium]|nr:lyase [Thermodesulfobacteriota bacterium]